MRLNSVGEGKGLATYFKVNKAKFEADVKCLNMQTTKLRAEDIDIISVYRSSVCAVKDMVDILKDIIKENLTTIIVGDFNLCMIDEKTNGVIRFLEGAGFSQHTMDATHLLGGQIDHVYSNHNPAL